MSYILTNVRVYTVATSDVQSILEIPVTDEIHMEGHLNHVVTQIAGRKIRISLDKLVYSFLEVKLQCL